MYICILDYVYMQDIYEYIIILYTCKMIMYACKIIMNYFLNNNIFFYSHASTFFHAIEKLSSYVSLRPPYMLHHGHICGAYCSH